MVKILFFHIRFTTLNLKNKTLQFVSLTRSWKTKILFELLTWWVNFYFFTFELGLEKYEARFRVPNYTLSYPMLTDVENSIVRGSSREN